MLWPRSSWDPVLLVFFEVEELGSQLRGVIGMHLLLGGEDAWERRDTGN